MANSSNAEKPKKTNFFRGVKQEFKKISWPTRSDVIKQTVVVTVISVVLGLLIAGIDLLVKYGMNFLTNLSV